MSMAVSPSLPSTRGSGTDLPLKVRVSAACAGGAVRVAMKKSSCRQSEQASQMPVQILSRDKAFPGSVSGNWGFFSGGRENCALDQRRALGPVRELGSIE